MVHVGVEHTPAVAKWFITANQHNAEGADQWQQKGNEQIIPLYIFILRKLHGNPPLDLTNHSKYTTKFPFGKVKMRPVAPSFIILVSAPRNFV